MTSSQQLTTIAATSTMMMINDSIEGTNYEDSDTDDWAEKAKTCVQQCFSIKTLKKKVPIVAWLPKYSWSSLQSDMIAGITVGLTVIPQGLAYAQIGELPPQYGLYAAFMGCFVYCFLGTSKDISVGPTAIMSLMVATFAISPIDKDPTYAVVLTLMLGLVQLVMGVLNLGILVNFISYPVISAFTTTAAIFIAFGQLKGIFGLVDIPRDIIQCIYWTFAKLGQTNKWDCGMGITSMIVIYFMKNLRVIKWRDGGVGITRAQKIARKVIWVVGTATNSIVVICASALVAVFKSQEIYSPITTCQHIQAGLPPVGPPAFSLNVNGTEIGGKEILKTLGVGLIIVPILGLIELIAIGNTFARKNNYRLDATQELVALGVANIISSFFSSYPVTGSFSRTAINSQSGSCTPAAGIFTGALVLLALGVFSSLFVYIPIATLSAMIIVAVLPMVDLMLLRDLWRQQKLDLVPWFVTVIMSFVLGIEFGIMCGAGISLLFLLFPIARPKIRETGRHITVVTLGNGLQYPAADYLNEKITELSMKDDVCIILDCRHIYAIDFSTLQMFVNLQSDLRKKGVSLVLLATRPHLLEQLSRTGEVFATAPTLEQAHWLCEESLNISEETRSLLHEKT